MFPSLVRSLGVLSLSTLLTIFSLISANPASACMAKLVHAGAAFDSMVPPSPVAGESVAITFGLNNVSECDANGYKLAFHSVLPASPECLAGNYSGNNPSFSIGNNTIGTAVANIPSMPSAACTVYFDILDASGKPLPVLPKGRLYETFGYGGPGMCIAPTPSINSTDHVGDGAGNIFVRAETENLASEPILGVNKKESCMVSDSENQYTGGDAVDQPDCTNTITGIGQCGLSAFLQYVYKTSRSALFGASSFLSNCGGTCGKDADPVNTAIGNFVQQETDATVAGPGDSTIRLNRTYNSQAVLWTPASRVRFYPDGSSEVMAEPPQYFGKGWTSELGQYLLEIDMAPTFEGVQILYPDGYTANFKKSGSQYVSVLPGVHDVITKEGDEYVMRDTDCGCASRKSTTDERFGPYSRGRLGHTHRRSRAIPVGKVEPYSWGRPAHTR